jgi:DNA repair photolyase
MSSVTDPYQPIEAKQQLTRHLLEAMVPYQPTLVIQTRSPMITRDFASNYVIDDYVILAKRLALV